jgi:Tol biopolymer transport system component
MYKQKEEQMKMKKNSLVFTVVLVLALSLGIFAMQSGQDLFQKALTKERVEGNLEEAIGLYQKVINESQDKTLKAQAQLRIGMCYERLGQRDAIKAYELVLENYSGQTEQVAAARARLAELKKEEPKGLTVTKTRFGMNEPFDLSPDGTKMVGVHISPSGGQNIVVSHLGKMQRDYITNFEWMDENSEYIDEHYWTYNPVWSPDGMEIVYLVSFSSREGKSDNKLSISSLEGKTRILIRSETDRFTPYAWMPDKSFILTIKVDKDNKQELGLVSSQGGEFKTLISLQGQVEIYGKSRATASVSPDGRFIVYTDISPGEESDLFITTSDGKTSWPLAPNPAIDKMPRWSPDGRHIVFLSNRHGSWALWGVAVDKGKSSDPFLIREGMGNDLFGNWTVHGLVSWSWIRMRDIFLLDVNPTTGEPVGKPRQLDYMPAGFNTQPAFAPEGNRLAFIRGDRPWGKGYLVVTSGNIDSLQEIELPEGFSPMMIRWMPNGSGIGIYGGNVNGENILLSLSFDSETWKTNLLPNLHGWRPLNFAGSGKTILYGKNGLVEDGAGIFERNLETGEERLVYKPKEGGKVNFMVLECSKDYKKLAFLESRMKLMVVDLETGKSNEVTSNSLISASWSPNGQRIISSGSFDSENGGKFLYVFSLAQGSVEEYDLSKDLPQGSQIRLPDWSADGTQVAFVLTQNKSEHLIYKNIIPKEKK